MLNLKTETAVGLFMAVACATFFYMTFQIGFFRLDRGKYSNYCICFTDASGLHKKADVKAFGMKVGWVDSIMLVPDQHKVCATIMILRECILHADALGIIRQDGILGEKYLEVIPGSPQQPVLAQGQTLLCAPDAASVDSLLSQMHSSISNISQLASSARETFCTPENNEHARGVMSQLGEAAQHLSQVAQAVNALVATNQEALGATLKSLTAVMQDVSTHIPVIARQIEELTSKLSNSVAPAFERSIDEVTGSLCKHITEVSQQCTSATEQVAQVARTINEGKGTLGQLIHNEKLSESIQQAVEKVQGAFSFADSLRFMSDNHVESMLGRAEHTDFNEFKAYLDVRLYPSPDYFYLTGLVYRQTGFIWREKIYGDLLRAHGSKTVHSKQDNHERLRRRPVLFEQARIFDQWLWNLQFGKLFGNYGFRAGLFESTVGVALDLNIPLMNDYVGWVSSLEAWDFRGRLRINDDRPHLKWINRLFVGPNLYVVFGADDFASRHNSNFFFGAGLRFDDDDVGTLLSYLPGGFSPL